ncbi:MAG TPA: hypothetical protein VJ570_07370 [Holophagaceae bacterium]|nr:hypothetical protein [Holophagaceae bacterium]
MSLEAPLTEADRRSERRWAVWAIGFLVVFLGLGAWTSYRMLSLPPPPAPPVDHGPLPAPVRAEVMALLESQLDKASFEERWEEGRRDFHIAGTPRNTFVSAFLREFKPLVAQQLMPKLRPYGEVISFEIYNTDLPPARLRDTQPAHS